MLRSARAMVSSGLIDHGWTYVNIDDTWQGPRGGPFNAIQGNKKFPDMKGLCDEIHAMGLKAGHLLDALDHLLCQVHRRFQRRRRRGLVAEAGQREVLAARQVSVRRQRRPAVGGLGIRLPEIRLEPQRPCRTCRR